MLSEFFVAIVKAVAGVAFIDDLASWISDILIGGQPGARRDDRHLMTQDLYQRHIARKRRPYHWAFAVPHVLHTLRVLLTDVH